MDSYLRDFTGAQVCPWLTGPVFGSVSELGIRVDVPFIGGMDVLLQGKIALSVSFYR
jgi:hypothetical protein